MVPGQTTRAKVLAGILAHVAAAEARMELTRVRAEVAAAEQAVNLPAAHAPRVEGDRAVVPASLLWGSLFAALPRGPRKSIDGPLVQSGGLELRYAGERLGQDDLDVFLALLRIAQNQQRVASLGAQLGVTVQIRGGELLAMLGLTDTGGRARTEGGAGSRDRLELSLRRLVRGTVELRGADGELYLDMVHLVTRARRGRSGSAWSVTLERDLFRAFTAGIAGLDLRVRRALHGRPLAQWLHAWLSSHGGVPRPHGLDTLRQLSGSRSQPKEFRRVLERALSVLEAAIKETGASLTWSIRAGILTCRQVKSVLYLEGCQ